MLPLKNKRLLKHFKGRIFGELHRSQGIASLYGLVRVHHGNIGGGDVEGRPGQIVLRVDVRSGGLYAWFRVERSYRFAPLA